MHHHIADAATNSLSMTLTKNYIYLLVQDHDNMGIQFKEKLKLYLNFDFIRDIVGSQL